MIFGNEIFARAAGRATLDRWNIFPRTLLCRLFISLSHLFGRHPFVAPSTVTAREQWRRRMRWIIGSSSFIRHNWQLFIDSRRLRNDPNSFRPFCACRNDHSADPMWRLEYLNSFLEWISAIGDRRMEWNGSNLHNIWWQLIAIYNNRCESSWQKRILAEFQWRALNGQLYCHWWTQKKYISLSK